MTSSSFATPTAEPRIRPPSSGRARRRPRELRMMMVSTYPPKMCGLATFAAALSTGLEASGHRVDILRVVDETPMPFIGRPPRADGASTEAQNIAGYLQPQSAQSLRHASSLLSTADVAIIQHEFGIFGGPDGDDVLDLVHEITTPIIVVLHTVPLHPSTHQTFVLERLAARADRLVVMTEAAKQRLLARYNVDALRVQTIPHGAALPLFSATNQEPAPELLTWGLLGPGKGIEHTISALAQLKQRGITARYTVSGVTHPKIVERDGESYRESLKAQAHREGVADQVNFDETYRTVTQLTRFVASSSLVVLPYDSTDQVTSGVLVDAIAAGTPVIATAFPHAIELLSTGAGIVVPHRDPKALAEAIASLVTNAPRLQAMTAEANRLAPSLSWSAVAAQYGAVAESLVPLLSVVSE
jgi:polysaccharide biosynthesis protein PslF